MTLIAAYKNYSYPVLLGDLVISQTGSNDFDNITLPTRCDLDNLLPPGWCRNITGLQQKIYKISNFLVVGWTGHKFVASKIISDLYARLSFPNPAINDLKACLASHKYFNPKERECKIIGWLKNGPLYECFIWDLNEPDNILLTEQAIEGSGKEYFLSLLKPDYKKSGIDPVTGALSKLVAMIGNEMQEGFNLQNLFGGGFQLIYAINDRFEVLKSATIVFLVAREDVNGSFSIDFHRRLIKYEYVDGLVMIHNANIGKHFQETHVAIPLNFNQNEFDSRNISRPSFVSEYYGIYLDIYLNNGIQFQTTIAYADSEKNKFLKVTKTKDGEDLSFSNNELLRFMQNSVNKAREMSKGRKIIYRKNLT